MSDEFLIQKCREGIEIKFGQGDSLDWKNEDFIRLSEDIFEHTKVRLSPDTLKRLFGKKKTANEKISMPYPSTRDALAKYIGFSHWADFVRSSEPEKPNYSESHPLKEKKKPIYTMAIWLIAGFLSSLAIVFYYVQKPKELKIPFSVQNKTGAVPLNVNFKYKIHESSNVDYHVDYGIQDLLFKRSNPKIQLDKKHSNRYEDYQHPDYYKIKLFADSILLDSDYVYATSDKWWGLVGYPDHTLEAIDYLNKEGNLTFDPAYINKIGFLAAHHFVTQFRYFNEIPLSADSCKVSLGLMNNTKTGSKPCFDIWIDMLCEKGNIGIQFVQPGCEKWVQIQASDVYLDGRFHNLKMYGVSFDDFRDISIHIENKILSVAVDNKTIDRQAFHKDLGKIKGFKVKFKGIGMLDYIKVSRHNGDMVYQNNFD